MTHRSEIVRWEDRPTLATWSWTERGIPVEILVDLCNRLKSNPWFCMPHRADDDFVRNFARVVRERLVPALKVYVEYSSDVWDYRFRQTRAAEAEGMKRGLAERPREVGSVTPRSDRSRSSGSGRRSSAGRAGWSA